MTPPPEKTSPTTDKWAVLAYLVADSPGINLDLIMDAEIAALAAGANSTSIPVSVQVDYRSKNRGVIRAVLERVLGDKISIVDRFTRIKTSSSKAFGDLEGRYPNLHIRSLSRGPETNAARAKVMNDFIAWGRSQSPGVTRYLLLLCGHSLGPVGLFFDQNPGPLQALSLPDLGNALKTSNLPPIDIVVFKDCFMSVLEVIYQLKEGARFVVASQAEVPLAIWDYKTLFQSLIAAADEKAAACALCTRLGEFYDDARHRTFFEDVPYTALDVEAVDEVSRCFKRVVDALATEKTRRSDTYLTVRRALEDARGGDRSLVDVERLCDNLDGLENIRPHARNLKSAINQRMVRLHHARTTRFHGVSVFCSPASYIGPWMNEKAYAKLPFNASTGWGGIAYDGPVSLSHY